MKTIGSLINVSGRQRMLSHRVIMFLALSQVAVSNEEREDLISAAERALDEFELAQGLLAGGKRAPCSLQRQSARVNALLTAPRFDLNESVTGAALVNSFIARSRACAKCLRLADCAREDGSKETSALATLVAGDLLDFLNCLVSAFEDDLADAMLLDQAKVAEAHVMVKKALQNIQVLGSNIHLIALNALIEAGRAGDAGRTFAIVATEIKSLSVQARNEAARLAGTINDLFKRSPT